MAPDGCAIFENWTGADGGEGKSLFSFDARRGAWDQVWVTGDTSKPGGVKHKRLTHRINDGVRFEGEALSIAGKPWLDRTTLTPADDGRVRQLIETSIDGGATWKAVFDGYYRRKD